MSSTPPSEIAYDPPAAERPEVSKLVHAALKQQVFSGEESLKAMIALPPLQSILECTRLRVRQNQEGGKTMVLKVELPVHDVEHRGEKMTVSLHIDGEFEFVD